MLNQKFEQRMGQASMQSPYMQQSLKILQMSNADLLQHIQAEIMQIPFLQIEEDNVIQNSSPGNDNAKLYGDDEQHFTSVQVNSAHEKQANWQENTVQTQISLREYIVEQINIMISHPQERLIACYLTDNLDQNGYLTENISTIAQNLQCSERLLQKVLQTLYKCDPIGVFSSSLEQCLKLQLIEKGLFNNKFAALLANLQLIASNEFKKLAKICDVSLMEFQQMLEVIRNLDPKPGRNFCNEQARVMLPDIHIRKSNNENLYIFLEQSNLPNLTINSAYFNQAIAAAQSKDEKQYCLQTLQQASNLIKAIAQRNRMLLRAVEELLEMQKEFFLRGISFLKPMTYKELAQKLGVHESTVSRLGNKVVATPVGTFELKHFFSTGLKANFMENEYSVKVVKLMLKELVEKEDSENILSDIKLANLLNESGIVISRRTVAKYRESLAIQTAAIRRRQKSLKGSGIVSNFQ